MGLHACPASNSCSTNDLASFMDEWLLSRASVRPSLCSSVAWTLFLVIPCFIGILEGPLQSFALWRLKLQSPTCMRSSSIPHANSLPLLAPQGSEPDLQAEPEVEVRGWVLQSALLGCNFVAYSPLGAPPPMLLVRVRLGIALGLVTHTDLPGQQEAAPHHYPSHPNEIM
jgi:hypothetical protein